MQLLIRFDWVSRQMAGWVHDRRGWVQALSLGDVARPIAVIHRFYLAIEFESHNLRNHS